MTIQAGPVGLSGGLTQIQPRIKSKISIMFYPVVMVCALTVSPRRYHDPHQSRISTLDCR